MKLSLKQKALLQTAGFLFTAIAAAIGVNLILEHVPFDVLIKALMVGVFGWVIYLIYGLILLRLESEEITKKSQK